MGRNRNFRAVVIAWGMLALLGLSVTRARADGPSVPFKADWTSVSAQFNGNNFVAIDAGQATHFGSVVVTINGVCDPSNGTFSATLTIATANGDLVFGTLAGRVTGPTTAVTSDTFTGGTGLFKDLTGSATENITFTSTGEIHEVTGTISY